MTKERARANQAVRPIESWENQRVNGLAFVSKQELKFRNEQLTELRERQEAYEKGLPKEPEEALGEINTVLCDALDLAGVKSALEIILQITIHGGLDDTEELHRAIHWLTSRGLDDLAQIEKAANHAKHIAHQFDSMHKPFEA